jgi:hypothetical protein
MGGVVLGFPRYRCRLARYSVVAVAACGWLGCGRVAQRTDVPPPAGAAGDLAGPTSESPAAEDPLQDSAVKSGSFSGDAGMRPECAAQDARAPSQCRGAASEPTYAWHGASCDRIYCPCSGLDCNDVWENAFECAQQYAGCETWAAAREQCLRLDIQGQEPLSSQAAQAQENCAEDRGSGCDPAAFISRGAAECIARAAGLQPGLHPWESTLGYQGYGRMIWDVENTLRDGGAENGIWGDLYAIDATTGILIEKGHWGAIQ